METEVQQFSKAEMRRQILKRLSELKIPNFGTDQNFNAEEISKEIKSLEKKLLELDPPDASSKKA